MNASGWAQLILFTLVLLPHQADGASTLVRVLDAKGRTWLDPVLKPLERLTYRLIGVDPGQRAGLEGYTVSMLLFSLVACFSPMSSCGCSTCCRSTRRDSAR